MIESPRILGLTPNQQKAGQATDSVAVAVRGLSSFSATVGCVARGEQEDQGPWFLPAALMNSTHVQCFDDTGVLRGLSADGSTVELFDGTTGLKSQKTAQPSFLHSQVGPHYLQLQSHQMPRRAQSCLRSQMFQSRNHKLQPLMRKHQTHPCSLETKQRQRMMATRPQPSSEQPENFKC